MDRVDKAINLRLLTFSSVMLALLMCIGLLRDPIVVRIPKTKPAIFDYCLFLLLCSLEMLSARQQKKNPSLTRQAFFSS